MSESWVLVTVFKPGRTTSEGFDFPGWEGRDICVNNARDEVVSIRLLASDLWE